MREICQSRKQRAHIDRQSKPLTNKVSQHAPDAGIFNISTDQTALLITYPPLSPFLQYQRFSHQQ
jgi:hypothetical protein